VDLDPDLAAALRPTLHLPPRPFHRLAHGAVALVLALAPAADLDPRDPGFFVCLKFVPRVITELALIRASLGSPLGSRPGYSMSPDMPYAEALRRCNLKPCHNKTQKPVFYNWHLP
jgi:hypothetical protein